MLSEIAVTVALSWFSFTAPMPNLYLKDGVRINGAHFYPEIVKILDAARDTAPKMERGAVWVTSANDSRHLDNSLHYKNQAFDIRIYNIAGDIHYEAKRWADRLQAVLGPDYDVVYELDHIHIEYQPKVMKYEEEPEDDHGVDYSTS